MNILYTSATALLTLGFGVYSLVAIDIPRIVKAKGYTNSTTSSWKAISPQVAVLIKLPIPEHGVAKKGQVIAELSAERFSQNYNIEKEQAFLAQKKIDLGNREINELNISAVHAINSLRTQLAGLQQELVNVESEFIIITLRLQEIHKQYSRYKELENEGFISKEALEVKNSELLRLMSEKISSERQQIILKREISKQSDEITLITQRVQTQKLQLMREFTNFQQELNEHTSKKIQLVSPINGFVEQVSAKPGQVVKPDIPLLTVIPDDGGVEVILLLPSRSIGFVREGQRVSVRYQAYPHEHYGRHFGTVREISRVALPPHEVNQHIKVDEPV
jgi:membrane fusion protein